MISRADMAARGVGQSTADYWYRRRDANGYPEKAGRIGRTDYWYEDEWTAWLEAHRQRKRDSLTRGEQGGDPDELVDATGAARIMGWADRRSVHASRRQGYFPDPDGEGRSVNGSPAPLWKRSTVQAFARRRTGKAGRHLEGTPGAPGKPHPYAGDYRLEEVLRLLDAGDAVSAAELAARWRAGRRTAQRIVKAARELRSS